MFKSKQQKAEEMLFKEKIAELIADPKKRLKILYPTYSHFRKYAEKQGVWKKILDQVEIAVKKGTIEQRIYSIFTRIAAMPEEKRNGILKLIGGDTARDMIEKKKYAEFTKLLITNNRLEKVEKLLNIRR